MSDLIDRDALIAEYDRVHVGAPGGARKLMVDAPRVDAEPARYAHWKLSENHPPYYTCSECGDCYVDESWTYNGKFNYCPNCGAKMDEEAEI